MLEGQYMSKDIFYLHSLPFIHPPTNVRLSLTKPKYYDFTNFSISGLIPKHTCTGVSKILGSKVLCAYL